MSEIKVALIGNPNSGKTSIFNILTKQEQRVANWPGMTVEQKSGKLEIDGTTFSIIDLPGCYSLNNKSQLDEKITTDFLLNDPPDLIINIIHSCKLSQHLYLTMQVVETNIPTIIVLNFVDQMKHKNAINKKALAQELNCPVVSFSARKNLGTKQLLKVIYKHREKPKFSGYNIIDGNIKNVMCELTAQYKKYWVALQLIEDNISIRKKHKTVTAEQLAIADSFDEEADIIIADIRYNLIQNIINKCQEQEILSKAKTSSYKIDQITLHPVLGLPIFLGIMYFMFSICLVFGSEVQEPFAKLCDLWLVKAPLGLLIQSIPEWLNIILYNGVGTAITTTLSFIPPLFLLFATLNILEQSGYMARAAFITDRLMSLINLPGRAFVSLLIGFGCNVPAIMSTRTLQSQDDRILTAMMTPFMSCTARLALYVVLVQAFFKENGSQIIFAIYSTGIIAAILTGFIVKKLLPNQASQPQIIELPEYICPSLTQTIKETFKRIRRFIGRTLKFMLVACSLMAILDAIPGTNTGSILSEIAKSITVILQPIGIDQNSWPTTIALIMGTIAKEVMIGIFYTLGNIKQSIQPTSLHYLLSESANIWHSWLNASQEYSAIGNIRQLFHSNDSVIAFLLFSCIYLPCFSTLAALKKECGAKWGWLASSWSLILAYSTAALYFQWSNVNQHVAQTIIITVIVVTVIIGFVTVLKKIFYQEPA